VAWGVLHEATTKMAIRMNKLIKIEGESGLNMQAMPPEMGRNKCLVGVFMVDYVR
jgi:hypothetical protein